MAKNLFKIGFLGLLLSCSTVFADEYGDLMLSVSQKPPYEAASLLTQYQKENPSFGNVYYQLGKIFDEMIPSVHPLYDYGEITLYMYNARVYFGNCIHYSNADDVKKYARYYSDVADKNQLPTYDKLAAVLKTKIGEIKEKEQHLKTLYAAFYRMVDCYNNCTALFSTFNERYMKIKTAHLLFSEADARLLTDLSLNADTLNSLIADFKVALKHYPIDGYNPTFAFEPIHFYRLDGLTSSDFLKNDIRLWDYSLWVKTFFADNKELIDPWREEMNREQKRLSSLWQKWLRETDKVDLEEPVFADRVLLNKINKMDYRSFMLDYFDFMEQAVNVVAEVCSSTNVLNADPSDEELLQQVLLGYDVASRTKLMNADRANVLERIDEKEKYALFFDRFFSEKEITRVLDSIAVCSEAKAQTLFDNVKTNVENHVAQQDPLSCKVADEHRLFVESSALSNRLVECNAFGKELRSVEVGVGAPKFLKYNEITQDVWVATTNSSVLTLERCNFDGGVVSKIQLETDAEVVDVVAVDENCMLILNATTLENRHTDKRGVAVVLLDEAGNLVKQQFGTDRANAEALMAFKLSNNNIAIVGRDDSNRGVMLFVDAKAEWR